MMPHEPRLHKPPHLETLCEALQLAETAVSRYYAISPREWGTRFRYDVGSADDHPDLPFHPGALAQIARLSPASGGFPPRYRIVLKDEEILERSRGSGLVPLLTFVLAHELVHLVRFGSGRVPFEMQPGEIRSEEEEVHRITVATLEPFESTLGAHPGTLRSALLSVE
jgi:hypothetical protein